ncbi:hypothetical protein Aperf_G00000077966 [Anoplocephala perfoliata]
MSRVTEGYLCPECLLNLDSEAALMAHFERKHSKTQKNSAGTSFFSGYPNFVENHVTQYYKDLIGDPPISKSVGSDIILSSLLDGTLTPNDIPEIGLKSKLQSFLSAQAEKDALIARLTAERDSAMQLEGTQIADMEAKIKSFVEQTEKLRVELKASERDRLGLAEQMEYMEKELANVTKAFEDLKAEREEIKSLLLIDKTSDESLVDQIRSTLNNLKSHTQNILTSSRL